MGEKQTAYIEINGKRYDARSGKLLHGTEAATLKPQTKAKTAARHHGRHIDSVVPLKKPEAQETPSLKKATNQAARQATKPRPDISRVPAKVAARHARQHAQTLMRRSVLKPAVTAKQIPLRPEKSLVVQSEIRRPAATAQPKVSANSVEPSREQRAQSVPKSPAVSRYSKPLRLQNAVTVPAASKSRQNIKASEDNVPTKSNHQAFFDRALANAKPIPPSSSHAKKSKKSLTRKLVRSFRHQKSVFIVAASASAIVLVGAFALLANMNSIELKVAGMRAGIAANMPQYHPSGFDKSADVAYAPGKVTLNFFASDQSGRSYQLSQQKSDWNSTSLYDSLIAETNEPYQTVQQRGNIIYLYGNSNAAWVTGGTLYQINGDAANLSSDELLRIADSV